MRILLNKNKSKKSTNVNNSIPIDLVGRNRILPVDKMDTNINEIELYNKERNESNIIRLTCTINPLCSNVLFNNVTEIVVNEGSDNCVSLNYHPLSYINDYMKKKDIGDISLIHKSINDFNDAYDGIKDTQLSNEQNGFSYFCGLDIFNNHILRSNTFKTICKLKNSGDTSPTFNTIEDMMRDVNGNVISGYSDAYVGTRVPDIALHLYLADDILSFKECVSSRLNDKNGWFGFTNIGKFGTYTDKNSLYDIYKVINNRKSCDFIDMYPTRDLWYFTPKYNQYRKRIEKNWNYCLTYPSSSTTNIEFIRKETNSLKACMFDDILSNSIGTSGLKIYSVSKHGINKGDNVNIYSGDDVIIRNAEVVDVENDYIFSVYDNGIELSKKWKEISIDELKLKSFTYDNVEYKIFGSDYKYAKPTSGDTRFPILPNNKVNLDPNRLDISYKKIVEGDELEYYVRIFSRLPNWKYSETKPTEYEIYKKNSDLLYKNQIIDCEFENHISKLAFSKNIYNDDISEIVFTDDIDISYLKDNLGRPLSEIYLSIFKNNKGYREWYGIGNRNTSISETEITKDISECVTNTDTIEYSHCFGKLTCGFELSKESLWDDTYKNSLSINRIDNNKPGLKISNFLRDNIDSIPLDNDEIQYDKLKYDVNGVEKIYDGDVNFYGDLCCYSKILLDEYVIQPIDFRFNTAQRELVNNDKSYAKFSELRYDEITQDDYDNLPNSNFKISENKIENVCQRKEGYLYNPHFKIQIKTFSDELTTQKPYYLTIKDINEQLTEIYTLEKHYMDKNDKFILRILDNNNRTSFFINCEVVNVINSRKFEFTATNLNSISSIYTKNDILKYGKIIKPSEDIPNYAVLSTDGSCYYIWRELIQNGFDDENKIEVYPFTNGALYINKQINLFVRRQDPNCYGGLQSISYPYDQNSNILNTTTENNYYQEKDIEC